MIKFSSEEVISFVHVYIFMFLKSIYTFMFLKVKFDLIGSGFLNHENLLHYAAKDTLINPIV